MTNALSQDVIDQMRSAGYISAAQAGNPSLIPQTDGQIDWSAPQFQGLHPPANNAADQAAQTAATPDLRNGTNAAGQVNAPPAQPPPAPVPAQTPGVTAPQPPSAPQGIGASPSALLGTAGGTTPNLNPNAPTPEQDAMYSKLAAAGLGGGRPAGWQPSTAEKQPWSDATLAAKGQELAGQEAQATAQLDLDAAQGEAGRKAQSVQDLYDQADALSNKIATEKQQSELGAYNDHIESLQRTAEQAGKLDPDRWLHSKGIGDRVRLALAAALGGAGAALTHGQNTAMSYIMGQMDKDFDAQKEDAANAKANVGQAMSLYQFNKQRLGDEESARLATQVAQRTALASTLQRYSQDASLAPAARLRALQLMQPVLAARSQALQQSDEHNIGKISEKYQQYTPGGLDPIAFMKRRNEAKTLEDQYRGVDVENRSKEAGVQKTVAELATEQNKAGAPAVSNANFEDAAKRLKATAWNPARGIQGTDAHANLLQNEGFNTIYGIGALSKIPGFSRIVAQTKGGLDAFQIKPGDEQSSIDSKIANIRAARQELSGQVAAPVTGTTEGATADQ